MSGKAWIGIVLAVVFAGSVTARAVMGDEPEPAAAATGDTASGTSPGGSSFLPGIGGQPPQPPKESEPEKEPGAVESAMPLVSEASFFGMIGFALGYFARKVVKLGLILLAIFFIGIQGLSYSGVISVDWARALELFNDFVLNLKENQTVGEVLKDRIPTAGALVAGYWLGFRKG